MNSILKSTTLALLMLSTAAVIGCGRNSQPNRYPDNRYGRNGSPFPPDGNGPVQGQVGGPGPVAGGPAVPGGPIPPGGGIPGGQPGQGGQGDEGGQGGGDESWKNWSCSSQNIDEAIQNCSISSNANNVRQTLIKVSDNQLRFPIYVLWSKSLGPKLNLKGNQRLCLKKELCSADIDQPDYTSEGGPKEPKYDPTKDFDPQADGNQGAQNNQQNNQQTQPRRGNNLPKRDQNQNADPEDGSDN